MLHSRLCSSAWCRSGIFGTCDHRRLLESYTISTRYPVEEEQNKVMGNGTEKLDTPPEEGANQLHSVG
jgi:hypothetical protein